MPPKTSVTTMNATGSPSAGEPSKPRASPIPRANEEQYRDKILVLGWRKAGKTSCIRTVFQQVPAKEVPYLGVTQKVEVTDYESIIPLQIWDTPSNFELDQLELPLSSFSTIVYVMDMQQDDSYHEAIMKFVHIMVRAYLTNPNIRFAMFIHKAEVLSEDYRGENYAEIQRATSEEIEDFPYRTLQNLAPNFDFEDPSVVSSIVNHLISEVVFNMTSVHDVTLRDAWSKVIQGSMQMLPAVESLLLNFTEHSSADNTFLFDIRSGIILATDNRHRTDDLSEQVTEYLSSFLQFRDLYKHIKQQNPDSKNDEQEADGDEEDDQPRGWWDEEDPDLPWMAQATKLLPNTTLAMWQFTPYLALVVLLRTETWQARRGTIEYNLTFLRQGVRGILSVMS